MHSYYVLWVNQSNLSNFEQIMAFPKSTTVLITSPPGLAHCGGGGTVKQFRGSGGHNFSGGSLRSLGIKEVAR